MIFLLTATCGPRTGVGLWIGLGRPEGSEDWGRPVDRTVEDPWGSAARCWPVGFADWGWPLGFSDWGLWTTREVPGLGLACGVADWHYSLCGPRTRVCLLKFRVGARIIYPESSNRCMTRALKSKWLRAERSADIKIIKSNDSICMNFMYIIISRDNNIKLDELNRIYIR